MSENQPLPPHITETRNLLKCTICGASQKIPILDRSWENKDKELAILSRNDAFKDIHTACAKTPPDRQ